MDGNGNGFGRLNDFYGREDYIGFTKVDLFYWDPNFFIDYLPPSFIKTNQLFISNMIPEHEFLGVGVQVCLPNQIFNFMFTNMMTD